jgi:hypothetical protein
MFRYLIICSLALAAATAQAAPAGDPELARLRAETRALQQQAKEAREAKRAANTAEALRKAQARRDKAAAALAKAQAAGSK